MIVRSSDEPLCEQASLAQCISYATKLVGLLDDAFLLLLAMFIAFHCQHGFT